MKTLFYRDCTACALEAATLHWFGKDAEMQNVPSQGLPEAGPGSRCKRKRTGCFLTERAPTAAPEDLSPACSTLLAAQGRFHRDAKPWLSGLVYQLLSTESTATWRPSLVAARPISEGWVLISAAYYCSSRLSLTKTPPLSNSSSNEEERLEEQFANGEWALLSKSRRDRD